MHSAGAASLHSIHSAESQTGPRTASSAPSDGSVDHVSDSLQRKEPDSSSQSPPQTRSRHSRAPKSSAHTRRSATTASAATAIGEVFRPDGVFAVNKPRGVTSASYLSYIKSILDPQFPNIKLGFSGTLDSSACGLLIVGIGRGTKMLHHALNYPKQYHGRIHLGIQTDTIDVDGPINRITAVPDDLTADTIQELLQAKYHGTISQRPPMYSALKVHNRKTSELARKGKIIDMAEREVTIYKSDVLGVRHPFLDIMVECGRGVYIRSIARDIAADLGTVGHLTQLCRVRVGFFALNPEHHPYQSGIAEGGPAEGHLPHTPPHNPVGLFTSPYEQQFVRSAPQHDNPLVQRLQTMSIEDAAACLKTSYLAEHLMDPRITAAEAKGLVRVSPNNRKLFVLKPDRPAGGVTATAEDATTVEDATLQQQQQQQQQRQQQQHLFTQRMASLSFFPDTQLFALEFDELTIDGILRSTVPADWLAQYAQHHGLDHESDVPIHAVKGQTKRHKVYSNLPKRLQGVELRM